MLKNYAIKHKISTFASVFHGIRFKVKGLFVGTTSNFFLYLHHPPICFGHRCPTGQTSQTCQTIPNPPHITAYPTASTLTYTKFRPRQHGILINMAEPQSGFISVIAGGLATMAVRLTNRNVIAAYHRLTLMWSNNSERIIFRDEMKQTPQYLLFCN